MLKFIKNLFLSCVLTMSFVMPAVAADRECISVADLFGKVEPTKEALCQSVISPLSFVVNFDGLTVSGTGICSETNTNIQNNAASPGDLGNPSSTAGEHCWCSLTGVSTDMTSIGNSQYSVYYDALDPNECADICGCLCGSALAELNETIVALYNGFEETENPLCPCDSLYALSGEKINCEEEIKATTGNGDGTWAIELDGGTISGESWCSPSGNGNPFGIPDTVNVGNVCWCRFTAYDDGGGTPITSSNSSWIMMPSSGSCDGANQTCEDDCLSMLSNPEDHELLCALVQKGAFCEDKEEPEPPVQTCNSNQIDVLGDGTQCEDVKFTITTSSLTSGTQISFNMSAKGTFYVDWGDGNVQTITRSNTTDTGYSHTYSSAGTKTIRFAGAATLYATGTTESSAAIRFNTTSAAKINGVSGTLGLVFPVLGSNANQKPRFINTFKNCTALTSLPNTGTLFYTSAKAAGDYMFTGMFRNTRITSIPSNLFSNVTGTAQYLFNETFRDCTSLTSSGVPSTLFGTRAASTFMFTGTFMGCTGNSFTSIPSGLFSGITGSAAGLFSATFSGCNKLTNVPANLFGTHAVTTSLQEEGMFNSTFQDCTSLSSIPSGLFANISGAGNGLFFSTFSGCASLSSIPADLFANISGSGTGMFGSTFKGCTSLTSIPKGLFSGVNSSAANEFSEVFSGCTSLTGYIPPTTFSGLISNNHPTASNMWTDAFTNTNLATSCSAPSTTYTTGYEGSTAGSTWNGKVSCQCASGIDLGSSCVESKFEITTTNMSANTTFGFSLASKGTFYVDWGDGTSETITRANVTSNSYNHTYTTAGTYTIKFGGIAELYNTTSYTEAQYGGGTTIKYYPSIGFKNNTYIASMSGSLGSIFPTLGSNANQKPRFYETFINCTSLTGIPATLFTGITSLGEHMFHSTFSGCTNNSFTSIPSNLFDSLTSGTGAQSAFWGTFYGCTKITRIPSNLFAKVTGAANLMFCSTFSGCSALGNYIPANTFEGLVANNHPNATNMWLDTFTGTQLLTSCPSGTQQFTTGYEGSTNGSTWNGKVSCESSFPFNITFVPDGRISTTLKVTIAAKGSFNIDWGDALQTVNHSNATAQTHTHTYAPGSPIMTVRFGGAPTAYNDMGQYISPISFASTSTSNKARIIAAGGSLGALFPALGSSSTQKPVFHDTFSGLGGTGGNVFTISSSLFDGITTATPYLFYGTFRGTTLTSVPANLFSGISGLANNLFQETFAGCSGLTSVPSTLFGTRTTSSAVSGVFSGTFKNSGLTAIPATLFTNVTNSVATNGSMRWFESTFEGCTGLTSANVPSTLFGSRDLSNYMFKDTFKGCTGLTTIPDGLFNNITDIGGGGAYGFYGTFRQCTGLTKLPDTLFTSITAPRTCMFQETFNSCSNLGGYIPKNMFVGLITNMHGNATGMWTDTFTGTNLVTSCTSPLTQFITGYEGSTTGTTWMGKVSCECNHIDNNGTCIESKFAVTTTNLAANSTFSFNLSAKGTFYVDWGDGSAITVLNRSNTTSTAYSHTYTTAGAKTIRFGGTATLYSTATDSTGAAIHFNTNPEYVASLSGSLGNLFPQISNGINANQMARFINTFKNCTVLSAIPDYLFGGAVNYGDYAFFGTFEGCTGLQTLPNNLFKMLGGVNAHGYQRTFKGCTGLTTIPDSFFGMTNFGPYDYKFGQTFEGCTSLSTIPSGLFNGMILVHATSTDEFNGTFANCTSLTTIPANLFGSRSAQANMFYNTFEGSGLTAIPTGLFSGITGSAANLFTDTFKGCTHLTALPSGLFSGVNNSAPGQFFGTFNDCTALSGYIPHDAFSGLTSNQSPNTDMWTDTFTNTNLATSCPNEIPQFITGYEGSTFGTTWMGKVACDGTKRECPAGKYLTANGTSCTCCTANSYCRGGTFDVGTGGGIRPCATGLFSPAGMSSKTQCGRMLHVGNYSLYTANDNGGRYSPVSAPNLWIGNITDDRNGYFSRMTTTQTPITYGSNKYLKVNYNNTTYYVTDESTVSGVCH